MTALIFIAAIIFEAIGILACMFGTLSTWLLATNDMATINLWSPSSIDFSKRELTYCAAGTAAGGFVVFLIALSVISRIIAA